MARAYKSRPDGLIDHPAPALECCRATEGGGLRGHAVAAILVDGLRYSAGRGVDRIVDLRVRSPTTGRRQAATSTSLAYFCLAQRAYDRMNRGDELLASNQVEAALREYAAAGRAVPDNIEMVFWHAATLAKVGRVDESIPLFRRVFAHTRIGLKCSNACPRRGSSAMTRD